MDERQPDLIPKGEDGRIPERSGSTAVAPLGGDKSPKPLKGRRLGATFSKQWWGGIGAVATLIALIPATIALRSDPPSTETTITTTSQTGCNVVGAGNTVDCPITILPEPTQSLAGLQTKWTGAYSWYFDGPAKDLPTPPDYPADEWRGHCDRWLPWLVTQKRFYVTSAGVLLLLASGKGEQVVVTDITAKILKYRERRSESTVMMCLRGGGGDAGDFVTVDTRKPETRVRFGDSEKESVMPPATIELQDLEFNAAQVTIEGEPTRLYTGVLQITAQVNGEEKYYQYGSVEKPIRWMGDAEALYSQGAIANALDWDVRDHRWKPGSELDPAGAPSPEASTTEPPSEGLEKVEVVSESDGDACRREVGQAKFGTYPPARCRFWQTPRGRLTRDEAKKAAVSVACQRDLKIENPIYAEGQTNTWWVWAMSGAGTWDWFPETALAEGASNQPVNGVALCG